MRTFRFGLAAGIFIALLGLSGCGGGVRESDPEYEKQLRAFSAAYKSFVDSTRLSPSKLDDLKKDWGAFPLVREDIQAGQFIVEWGVELEPTAAENDKYVLGYMVDVPENGGLVLLGGGRVRHVTAEEFMQLGRFKPQGKRAE